MSSVWALNCWCVFNGRELFSPAQKYQLLVYHADAIFHDKEYRNAACKYSMALQQKKVLSKTSKVRTSTGGAASNIQAQVCLTISCNQKQTEIYNSILVTCCCFFYYSLFKIWYRNLWLDLTQNWTLGLLMLYISPEFLTFSVVIKGCLSETFNNYIR